MGLVVGTGCLGWLPGRRGGQEHGEAELSAGDKVAWLAPRPDNQQLTAGWNCGPRAPSSLPSCGLKVCFPPPRQPGTVGTLFFPSHEAVWGMCSAKPVQP